MTALTHLLQRLRRRMALHFLRGRQHQLQQTIRTLETCIAGDQALLGQLRIEHRLITVSLDATLLGPQRRAVHPRDADAAIFKGPL